ncbi:hypothetical protein TrLO_g13071 [Triparma laevis f. longispina]|uniref:Uncharacterized protein n=1 Tax=Triparma laevis f. longispina TaxID=1714387 RepID=A0A9W7FKI1_9STRA|nr:hypothetical protein TrLO_g13071 [Triparma laevis f. longispina]
MPRLEHGVPRVTLAQAPPPKKEPSKRKGKTKKDHLSDSEGEGGNKVSQKDRRENVEGFAITKREQQKLYAREKTDKVRGKFKGLKTKERKKKMKSTSKPNANDNDNDETPDVAGEDSAEDETFEVVETKRSKKKRNKKKTTSNSDSEDSSSKVSSIIEKLETSQIRHSSPPRSRVERSEVVNKCIFCTDVKCDFSALADDSSSESDSD